MVQREFETDADPGKPKILFIGHASSSHAHSWIDLLNRDFEIRMFGLPETLPPEEWKVKNYVTTCPAPWGLDPRLRMSFGPTPEELQEYQMSRERTLCRIPARLHILFDLYVFLIAHSRLAYRVQPPKPKAASVELWLQQIINEWKPDVVQTLGLDPASFFYCRIHDTLTVRVRWVIQTRGGSDLTLARLDPEASSRIRHAVTNCDQIICDNRINFEYLRQLGVKKEQIASVSPVPGTGGIEVEQLSRRWEKPPSQRRMILLPKAYESNWAKTLPIFEAIKLAWDSMEPCEIYILWMTPYVGGWFRTLPKGIREHCHVHEHIPRKDVLDLMLKARIMLAPSLVDGIPNSLYEAMACGAFPIVSPLDTIGTVLTNERNTLFARNLYPGEIAEALVRAMNDDNLIDAATKTNLELVRELADRTVIAPRLVAFYKALIGRAY